MGEEGGDDRCTVEHLVAAVFGTRGRLPDKQKIVLLIMK